MNSAKIVGLIPNRVVTALVFRFFFAGTRHKENVPRKLGCKNFQFLAFAKKKRRFLRGAAPAPCELPKKLDRNFLGQGYRYFLFI